MIAIICAMSEERDALLKLMKDYKVSKGKKLLYHGEILDNQYYTGKIEGHDVVVTRCGVGEVYASITTVYLINKYKPEMIINLGVAGSVNDNVHVNDVVIADKVSFWRFDVPEPKWVRSFDNNLMSFKCDENLIKSIKKRIRNKHIHIGPIVSADEFIYHKSQLKVIRIYYPEALCGEMEAAGIAATCYAHNVPVMVIRSISDEALVHDNYMQFDFNLNKACDTAARICVKIIRGIK